MKLIRLCERVKWKLIFEGLFGGIVGCYMYTFFYVDAVTIHPLRFRPSHLYIVDLQYGSIL